VRFEDLADIVRREVGESLAIRILRALRRDAGGEQIYIPQKEPPPEVTPRDTVHGLRERHRISRSTAYNWVNRWKSKL